MSNAYLELIKKKKKKDCRHTILSLLSFIVLRVCVSSQTSSLLEAFAYQGSRADAFRNTKCQMTKKSQKTGMAGKLPSSLQSYFIRTAHVSDSDI